MQNTEECIGSSRARSGDAALRSKEKRSTESMMFLAEKLKAQKVGRELVFSADFCWCLKAWKTTPSSTGGDKIL